MIKEESSLVSTVSLHNINLSYGSLKVLNNLNLRLNSGEIHAILGEHGAGKSSLAKIITGFVSPQSGHITILDNDYESFTLKEARNKKVHMVYQDSALNPYFTVAENLFYSDKKIPFISWKHKGVLIENAENFLREYGFKLDPRQETNSLNCSDRTILELLVNIRENPSILILDESLENISTSAFPKILDIIFDLKRSGCTVLIITHKVDGIYDLADRITIIKNGECIYSDAIGQMDKIQLIKIAYTQIADTDESGNLFTAFYEMIKYNEAILINLPVNLITIDTMKSIRLINQFCMKNFNIGPEEYLGKQISELFQETRGTQTDTILRSINNFHEEQFFHFNLTINGIEGIFNVRIFPVKDDGFLLGCIILLEDITEYSNLQKRDIISEKLASLGLLAAGVAHEINNPLEIIYNYLTNLRFKFSSKDLQNILLKIQNELDYITHIVSILQDFSGEKLAVEDVIVNHQIKEVIDLIYYNANKSNIQILFNDKCNDAEVTINKNQLKQVLLNLFKNSFEAMKDGGTLTIETSIHFSGKRKNLCISFKDTGTGMQENRNPFVPFYSTKQENKITGLGLSICHSIITKYNGNITINNNANGGCIVIIELPVKV